MNEKTICPLLRDECLEEKCEWYMTETYFNSEQCAVVRIAWSLLSNRHLTIDNEVG